MIDRNVHASLYDGARLGQAAGATPGALSSHNDPESLDKALEKLGEGEGALVITDGVFSAEGEIARLDEIVKVVKSHGARLFVDDAHALGVIGPGGRGTAHSFGVSDQVDLDRRHLLQVARQHRRLAGRRAQGARLHSPLRTELHVRGERGAALRGGGDGGAST